MGRLSPDVQVVIMLTLSPMEPASKLNRYCLTLEINGVEQESLCNPLPEIIAPEDASSTTSDENASHWDSLTGPLVTVSFLYDVDNSPYTQGITLVIRNDGNAPASKTHLALQFSSNWHLIRGVTSLGLISVVDKKATVRLGKLEPGEVVVIHVQGRNVGQEAASLCLVLFVDDKLYQSTCVEIAS